MNLSRNLHFLVLLNFLLFFKTIDSERKSKRGGHNKALPPKYEIYKSDKLSSDSQVTTFIYKGETKTFFYWSTINNGPLSATLITCSSTIVWSMQLREQNFTGINTDKTTHVEFETKDIDTKHFYSLKGLYMLHITARDRNTYVHIYISTEEGGPQALQNHHYQKIKLVKRPNRRKLTVRWVPSMVNPQVTDYCLVISKTKHYRSLCSAQADHFGILTPDENKLPVAASQTVISWEPPPHHKPEHIEPIIGCTGSVTHYTVSNLIQGQLYYFQLFAIDRQTNFTYPYGSTTTKFDKYIKPTSLKDGKLTFVHLKKLGGRAVFRYKVGKNSDESLNVYVMPCGGSIDIEITLKGKIVSSKTRIEGFGRVVVPYPKVGVRYYIKVLATNPEELRKTSGIEIYATTKTSSRIPLPNMPSEPVLEEYTSMRKCDSVTIGWLPSPKEQSAHYCLVVKEGKIRETDEYRMPNQCGLEMRLRKSADFILKYCMDIKHEQGQAITRTINQLKHGRSYIVQVTVKKLKGKTLSYDLLQVHTKRTCKKD